MANESVPEANKPITLLARVADRTCGFASADSILARTGTVHPKAEYTTATDPFTKKQFARPLAMGVHTRKLV